jgi:hypothetical protein
MVSNLSMALRSWQLATLGFLLPVCALAQEPPTLAELMAGLRSQTPATVAWAAFQAGVLQAKQTVPVLVATLEAMPAGTQNERDYLAAAVLDALVQIHPMPGEPPGIGVSPAAVAPYLDRWPIQTLVLLGRAGPERDPIVVDLFRSLPRKQSVAAMSPGEMWLALANLLVPRSPSEFAAMVLQGLRLELAVTVSDEGNVVSCCGMLGGLGIRDGVAQKPAGFPLHAEYRWGTAMAGSVVLSAGPRRVYYSRAVSVADQFPVSFPSVFAPSPDDRLAYLMAISKQSSQFGLKSRSALALAWSDAQTFNAVVRTEQQRIADAYNGVLTQLITDGRLTDQEAATIPIRLITTVDDVRTNRTPALPDVTQFPALK